MAKTLTIKIDLDKLQDEGGISLFDAMEETVCNITLSVYKDGKWEYGKGKIEGWYTPECGTWEVKGE